MNRSSYVLGTKIVGLNTNQLPIIHALNALTILTIAISISNIAIAHTS